MGLLLDLKHWQMLAAIADAGTMHAAADRLGTTQSALSHRLAEAERRLDGRLFDRDGRRLRLTRAGEALVQTARRILPALERAEADFGALWQSGSEVVRMGIAAYSAYHWLPRFLRLAAARLPQVEIDVVASATQNPTRDLLDGRVDLVAAPAHLAVPGIAAIPLFDDRQVLVVAPDHRLATAAYARPEDLAEETYLTYSRTRQPGFEYDRFIRPSGVSPRLLRIIENTDAIVELVASGFGVSILAEWAMRPAAEAGRVALVRVGPAGLPLNWAALLREADDTGGTSVRDLGMLLAEWCSGAGPEPE